MLASRHSHPPNPGCAETRLFPGGDGEFRMFIPSSLVRPSSGWARLLPTARLDEHRLSKNTMDLVCAFGEQRKLPSPPIYHLRSQAATEPCGFTHSQSRGPPSTSMPGVTLSDAASPSPRSTHHSCPPQPPLLWPSPHTSQPASLQNGVPVRREESRTAGIS